MNLNFTHLSSEHDLKFLTVWLLILSHVFYISSYNAIPIVKKQQMLRLYNHHHHHLALVLTLSLLVSLH